MTNVNDLMTKKAVAQQLGVTEAAVSKWMRLGKLSYYKLGRAVRFSQEQVDAMKVLQEVRA